MGYSAKLSFSVASDNNAVEALVPLDWFYTSSPGDWSPGNTVRKSALKVLESPNKKVNVVPEELRKRTSSRLRKSEKCRRHPAPR